MTCSFLTWVSRWRFAKPGLPSKAAEISLKWVANNTKACYVRIKSSKILRGVVDILEESWDTLLSTRAPQIANEIASPSVELVPLPSSSTITKLHLEILVNMNAISLISLEKVLTLN